ncbi:MULTISPECIES: stage III sporulation protein AA [unclassified Sporolactobacillus]|uniref:stage III sporulation protein AA n=1 Tax=unclassified Sporolactobacillus TaxID=2628533 RepID=UPI002367D987|nr:stage III sporulation protein AA [Sporolactobacillus sp. CQH2019]MDD9149290.1 stage III sporulation protein AA [Sporolactobacillus sp. CQH2019]
MKQILSFLPEPFQKVILQMSEEEKKNLEEIRCRAGRPLELIVSGAVLKTGDEDMPVFHPEQAKEMLQKISGYSLYALEEELRRGFITVQGGHRIGLAGRVITENGRVLRLRDVTFFNIRLAKQKIGAALPLVPYLYWSGHWRSSLIIGAPQTGKTTLLRDLARIISEGIPDRYMAAQKTGIVDERSEIAGCVAGIPQNRLGDRTDVLDACPKAEGMMMMIRSMSPDVLVVDEIGRKDDTEALFEAMNAGVAVIATAHGSSLEQLNRRPTLRPLIDSRLFERYVLLSRLKKAGKSGCRLTVCDQLGRSIASTEEQWQ